MALSLTPTKTGAWLIRYGQFREVLIADTITIVRPKQRDDVLWLNGMLIDSKKGRR